MYLTYFRLADEASKAWIISHLEHEEGQGQDFIDHDFYDFLSSCCVCEELAVAEFQDYIYNALSKIGLVRLFNRGHLCRLSLSGDTIMLHVDGKKNEDSVQPLKDYVSCRYIF